MRGRHPNFLLMTKLMTAGTLGAHQACEAVGFNIRQGRSKRQGTAADFTLKE